MFNPDLDYDAEHRSQVEVFKVFLTLYLVPKLDAKRGNEINFKRAYSPLHLYLKLPKNPKFF
jgi:hypothetical protein